MKSFRGRSRYLPPSEIQQPMFEHKNEALLPPKEFVLRMARSFAVTLGVVILSLLIGSTGYHFAGDLPWVDSLLNAAMILTGMGPVDPMRTVAGKLFATAYALYSGIAFLTMMAILLAPIMHRVIHKFHLADEQEESSADRNNAKGG
jgi:hypothetical protein